MSCTHTPPKLLCIILNLSFVFLCAMSHYTILMIMIFSQFEAISVLFRGFFYINLLLYNRQKKGGNEWLSQRTIQNSDKSSWVKKSGQVSTKFSCTSLVHNFLEKGEINSFNTSICLTSWFGRFCCFTSGECIFYWE